MGNLALKLTSAESIIESMIQKSVRSATPDNCQNLLFHVSGSRLTVDLNRSIPKHQFDPDDMTSQIGFGFFFEYLNQAAARDNHQFVVTSPLSPQFFPVQMELIISDPKWDLKLFTQETLDQRRCYREPFEKKDLPPHEAETIKSQMNTIGAQVIFNGSQEFKKLSAIVLEGDKLLWLQKQAVADTFQWIRWSHKDYQKKRDGFHYREIGAKMWDVPLLKLLTVAPALSPLLYPVLRPIIESKLRACLESSLGFFAVSVESSSEESRIQLGQLAARAWLQSTQMGFACQPLSLQSLLAGLSAKHKIQGPFLRDFEQLYEQAETILEANGKLFWLFRFGRLPANALPPSLRKSITVRFD